jgi:hypothetical protein
MGVRTRTRWADRVAIMGTVNLDFRGEPPRAQTGKITTEDRPRSGKGNAVDEQDTTTTRRQTLRHFGGGAILAALATAGFGGLVSAQDNATPTAGDDGVKEGLYVVVRTWTFKPGKSADELATLVREGFVPLIRGTPGFREYFNVWNADTRQWMAVSIFADKAGADESTERAKDWAAEHVPDFVEADPTVVEGQIVLYAAGANG